MLLNYERYLDQILGGWIGKSIGGTIGARFEGNKGWIEIDPAQMFPAQVPPNDDLDLQVLWLKVLEEKGAALTADDMAAAWVEHCWYPFNEYGIFRRNWRLGLHPPVSGRFGNQFWETGMGCPIRAEIWGYVFPGAPDLAARYARLDGSLDHTEQSIGAEQMLAAMSSMAFFIPDVRRLAEMYLHWLPGGSEIDRLVRASFKAHDDGLSLRESRDRILLLAGNPEACDARVNVPFIMLALLYGEQDMQETLMAALQCGFDTDCTMASAAALIGQIMGASHVPSALREPIGDTLVMGIDYRRPEMTLSALARDTARMGVLFSRELNTGVSIEQAPNLAGLPVTARSAPLKLRVEYKGRPAAAPGESLQVRLAIEGKLERDADLVLSGPEGWSIAPGRARLNAYCHEATFTLQAPAEANRWPMRHLFQAQLDGDETVRHSFGVVGAGLWRLLGVFFDPTDERLDPAQVHRTWQHHFVSLDKPYLPEPMLDEEALFQQVSRLLGRPAVVASYENEIDLSALIGLHGPYCAYLARSFYSPDRREVNFVIGNTDGYRLYLNGELLAEVEETVWWTPFNNIHRGMLRQGGNQLLLKLIKQEDRFRFTIGMRDYAGPYKDVGHNALDWTVDLEDIVPPWQTGVELFSAAGR